jgi:hypothetical protein
MHLEHAPTHTMHVIKHPMKSNQQHNTAKLDVCLLLFDMA